MTTFLLIRHATNDTVGRLIAGWTPDVHLNSEGKRQAEKLAERLALVPINAIYSSPLERARETAEPIAQKLKLEIVIREELGEIHFAAWTGRTLAELEREAKWQQFNSFRSGTRIPGGELMLEAQMRIIAELERLREQHPDEVVAVVSHGDLIKAAVTYYAGIHLDLFQRIEISPASVSIITISDHGPHILLVNDTGELPDLKRE